MANTDVGIAAGGLGKTIAAAIVQFNKASVCPQTMSMAAAVSGSNTVQFPVYTKLGVSDVTNDMTQTATESKTSKHYFPKSDEEMQKLLSNYLNYKN